MRNGKDAKVCFVNVHNLVCKYGSKLGIPILGNFAYDGSITRKTIDQVYLIMEYLAYTSALWPTKR